MEINTLLNDHWVKEIKKEIRKYLEKNENTIYPKLWDTVKYCTFFLGVISTKREIYNDKTTLLKRRQISNDLGLYLKELGKEQQAKHKLMEGRK